jgi:hypothetical protein
MLIPRTTYLGNLKWMPHTLVVLTLNDQNHTLIYHNKSKRIVKANAPIVGKDAPNFIATMLGAGWDMTKNEEWKGGTL